MTQKILLDQRPGKPHGRPILTLKKPAASAWDKRLTRARTRAAITFLAGLGIPLFQRMDRDACILPMAIGIREEVLARTDPALASKVRRAVRTIALSRSYKNALLIKGARRRTCDDEDAGPAPTVSR